MTGKKAKENDKGNGEPTPSAVVVTFPGPGAADPLNVELRGATPGQLAVASIWLLGMSLHGIFVAMSAQQQQAMKEQAMIKSLIGKV